MIPGVFVAEERASPCGNIRQQEQDKKKRAPAERAGGSHRDSQGGGVGGVGVS